jgi:hypothetical protein
MKKNKLFIYLLLLLPAFLMMQSCTKDQKDYFDDASSTRLANFNSNARKVLMSSEYGWVFDVYPGSSQKYGGVVYTVKFDSLTATVRSTLDPSLNETSYYKMTTESGSGFIFDTNNTLIHYLSEGTSSSYQAFGGDLEFIIDSVGTDLVKVHGARSKNTCYLHRLTYDPAEYIQKVLAIQDGFIYGTYHAVVAGKPVLASLDLNNNQFTVNPDTTNAESEEVTSAFIYTDKGIRLYSPLTINGITFTEFTFDYDAGTLTGVGSDGNTYVFKGVLPEGYRKFSEYAGNYTLAYKNGNGTVITKPVVLTADEANSCFYMTGLFANSPTTHITLTYSKAYGCLYWNSQSFASEGGNNVWLCAWSLSGGGTLTWSTDAGMKTVWNGDEANPVYKLVNNGLSSYTIDSYIVWTLTTSGTNVGQYKGTTYQIDGGIRLRYLVSLTKQ